MAKQKQVKEPEEVSQASTTTEPVRTDDQLVNGTVTEPNITDLLPDVVDGADRTLDNIDIEDVKKKVSDVKIFGDGNLFKLLAKASSKEQKWMKSTKAMTIPGLGSVVQVTTQQGDNVAEALVFVPRAKVHEELDSISGEVIARRLIGM